MHGSGADFDVVGLLYDATVLHPETEQFMNDFLKRLHR